MYNPTLYVSAVYVNRRVWYQMVGDGMVADADLEMWKWKNSPRGALYQYWVVLGYRHLGRVLVTDEVQAPWSFCALTNILLLLLL